MTITVTYQSGPSHYHAEQGVDYMLVVVDGVELYAEATLCEYRHECASADRYGCKIGPFILHECEIREAQQETDRDSWRKPQNLTNAELYAYYCGNGIAPTRAYLDDCLTEYRRRGYPLGI